MCWFISCTDSHNSINLKSTGYITVLVQTWATTSSWDLLNDTCWIQKGSRGKTGIYWNSAEPSFQAQQHWFYFRYIVILYSRGMIFTRTLNCHNTTVYTDTFLLFYADRNISKIRGNVPKREEIIIDQHPIFVLFLCFFVGNTVIKGSSRLEWFEVWLESWGSCLNQENTISNQISWNSSSTTEGSSNSEVECFYEMWTVWTYVVTVIYFLIILSWQWVLERQTRKYEETALE